MATENEDDVLAGAHEYWRSVALTQLLHGLDEAGLSIVDNQKTSLQERRKLAEKTKEFRAVPDNEKVTEFKPLLRAYQNEIDALTKRMKFAETSFLKLFKSLSEAPDPEPFLQSLLEERRVRRVDEEQVKEFKAVKGKCEDLEKENAKLQLKIREDESTAKRLRMLEENMEREIKQQVEQSEKELKEQTDDLLKHLKERECDLQRQLSSTTQKLSQSHFDSQEAERSSQSDRDLVGKIAELEILQADLDHAHSRIVDMQTQNAKLRATITSLTGTEDGSDSLMDYQRRIRDLEDETKRLYANLEKADAENELEKTQSSSIIAAAKHDVFLRNEELERLRAELVRCRDYDEIKRDLDIMKSVEFSVSDWGLDDEKNPLDANESLEKLLVRRNKSLENDLIDTKNRFTHTQNELQSLQQKMTVLEEELKQKALLAERLEIDLLAVGTNDRKSADNIISINPLDAKDDSIELQSTNIAKGNILEIVTGQRDRFRQRNIELEDELRVQSAHISEHQRQLNQLNHDNLRLYEEIKYLRSYTSNIASGGLVALPNKFSSNDSAKYKNMYEDSLNPFNTFHQNETTRKVKSMGLIDRLVYMISTFVAANRSARFIVLFYIGLLHLLVLGTLYRNILHSDEADYEHVTSG